MSTGPKSGWGGRREGAGRPKQTISAEQIENMILKAKKRADEEGKDLDDLLLDLAYDKQVANKDRIACIKVYKEYTIAKMSEGGDADKNLGPGVYLPNERPDPAKVVPLKTG